MKKLSLILVTLFTFISAQAKCDWTGYWMKKVNQQQNVFTFQTNVHWDTCVDYHWIVYDYQLKRWDTIQTSSSFAQVQFNAKGKYKVALKAVNKCTKPWCDTMFYQIIDITVYGKADVPYKLGSKNCKYYQFEMTKFDTCVEYYYSIYKSDYFDKMTEKQWRGLTDSAIYFGYDFDEKDLVYYNTVSQRLLTYEFKDSGRYLLNAYWYNKCTGIDTWVMRKLDVCSPGAFSNVKTITLLSPKLVGIYDMMGRPVANARENEILIYIYSDGTRKKVYTQK